MPLRTALSERIFRLPSRFLGDPLAALMEKELRTLSRIARFRMAYGMSCFFGVLIFAPGAARASAPSSSFMKYALPSMAVYGLLVLGQITYWNSFGFDRSAAQGYFCWPIKFRDALIAKNLTVHCVSGSADRARVAGGACFGIPSSPVKILETFAVMVIAALFWFALGNIFSVRMPRAMDPDKMNQMSNKLQALTILAAPVVLLPVVLAYWARAVFSNEFVFAGILAIAAHTGRDLLRGRAGFRCPIRSFGQGSDAAGAFARGRANIGDIGVADRAWRQAGRQQHCLWFVRTYVGRRKLSCPRSQPKTV